MLQVFIMSNIKTVQLLRIVYRKLQEAYIQFDCYKERTIIKVVDKFKETGASS